MRARSRLVVGMAAAALLCGAVARADTVQQRLEALEKKVDESFAEIANQLTALTGGAPAPTTEGEGSAPLAPGELPGDVSPEEMAAQVQAETEADIARMRAAAAAGNGAPAGNGSPAPVTPIRQTAPTPTPERA